MAFSRFVAFTRQYPIVRGMLSYATIWPTSCLIQQTIAGKRWENYDWMQLVRFSVYGCFITAPTLYGWVRISTIIWPKITVRTAVTKALVEQVTYGPFALTLFFFIMSLMENKTVEEATDALKAKFWATYKISASVWPVIQTFNFLFIPERNRVPLVSACSLVWCCFLAYMQQLQASKDEKLRLRNLLVRNK